MTGGGGPLDPVDRNLIHDLRNLLAVIVNYSELISQELEDPEAVRADVLEIRAAAGKAIALTEKLPRAARPSSEPDPRERR